MRIAAHAIMVATGVVSLISPALAADMTGAEIKAFISGKTVYVQTTVMSAPGKAGGGVIYWGEDGTALYKTATGALWHGKWEIKGNTACTDWKEKPKNPCVRYDKTGNTVTILDAVSGLTRGKVVKTAVGNAEKLTP